MLVEREREIRAFIPEEYWKITASKDPFNFELVSIDNQKLTSPEDKNPFFIKNEEEALAHLDRIKTGSATITNIEIKDTKSSPKAPFTTSTLLQSASTRLGFSPKMTMNLAQRLYENGWITYMRTDSTNLSASSIEMAHKYIKDKYGNEYLAGSREYKSTDEHNQEAHEAIRPTSMAVPEISGDAKRLYDLIRSQFLASQMTDAIYENTSISVEVENQHNYLFKASSKQLKFAGYYKAFGVSEVDVKDLAQGLNVGDSFSFLPQTSQNFTQPPSRYTEASLVSELKRLAIGRPSTYVSIISIIQDRGYATLENKRFFVSKIAEIITDCLEVSFPDIMSYDFTSALENSLDEIANGELNWKEKMNTFWTNFRAELEKASLPPSEGGMPPKPLVKTDFTCPKCHKHKMLLQCSKSDIFLSCEGYSEKGDAQCKNTVSLIEPSVVEEVLPTEVERCPKCHSPIEEYYIDAKNKLKICSNTPACDYTKHETGDFLTREDGTTGWECDKCGTIMELKIGRFGKYAKCPSCGNNRSVLPNGELAPPKEPAIEFPELLCKDGKSFFVLRRSAKGIFLGSNTFPKYNEIKTIDVALFKQLQDRMPEELQYLGEAPVEDSEGNPTIIRWSAKDKVQYIGSIKNGKPTKFRMDYVDGK